MKILRFLVVGSVAIMAVVFLAAICTMAGGISLSNVAFELSRHIGSWDAERIVSDDSSVETNLLVDLSKKNISSEAMTVLLLNKSFPQWRRSELIAKGREGFYFDNACTYNQLTDEDVHSLLKRRFVLVSTLEQALRCESLKEETKDIIRQKLKRTFLHRCRMLLDGWFGEIEPSRPENKGNALPG